MTPPFRERLDAFGCKFFAKFAAGEFQHFKDVMRGVLAVPKKRPDELVQKAKEDSPRNRNPHAPRQKPARTPKRVKILIDHILHQTMIFTPIWGN